MIAKTTVDARRVAEVTEGEVLSEFTRVINEWGHYPGECGCHNSGLRFPTSGEVAAKIRTSRYQSPEASVRLAR